MSDLSDAFECAGLWWLPGHEDQQVAGILRSTSAGEVTLELIGSFESLEGLFSESGGRYPLVLGFGNECKQVTLLDCLTTRRQFGMPGIASETLTPLKGLLLGANISDARHLEFERLSLRIERLSEWAGVSGLELEMTAGQRADLRRLQLTYEPPEALRGEIDQHAIEIASGFQTGGIGSSAPSVREILSINVTPDVPMSLEDLDRDFILPIQHLLTLGLDRPAQVSGVRVFSQHVTMPVGDESRRMPVELRRQTLVDAAEDEPDRPLIPHEMLFVLGDYPGGWSSLIPKWFETYQAMKDAINLFMGTRYAPARYVEGRFLTLAQALEVYDRRKHPKADEPSEEHIARINAVIGSSPDQFRAWLEQQLRFSHQPSFRRRVRNTVERVAPALSTMFPNSKAQASFVNAVCGARNYYTHWDESETSIELSGAKLHWLSQKIVWILKVAILIDLGLSPDSVKELLERNQAYQSTLRAIASEESEDG